jgi:hypothetical protein
MVLLKWASLEVLGHSFVWMVATSGKSKKGILLTTLGIDPNNCIFPIAMGLVEVECTSSWEWFLTTLKEDLNITNTFPSQ